MLVMIGLAAKNAILIVEFAVELRNKGMDLVRAAIDAGELRFRPIIMTSLAFIGGTLPLAVATGAGAASWQKYILFVRDSRAAGLESLLFVCLSIPFEESRWSFPSLCSNLCSILQSCKRWKKKYRIFCQSVVR